MIDRMINFDCYANVEKNKKILEIVNKKEYYNPHSSHSIGIESFKIMTQSTNIIKSVFSKYENVEFIPGGGSTANERALLDQAIIKYHIKAEVNDIIMIGSIEHSSISKYITRSFTDRSYTIILIPCNKDGIINLFEYDELLKKYKDRIVLITCMLVNNEIGTIQPINEMVKIKNKYNNKIIFHSDVGSSASLVNEFIDYPDVITMSCYKYGGPHYGLMLHNNKCKFRPVYYGTPDVYNIYYCSLVFEDYIKNKKETNENNKLTKAYLIEKIKKLFDENKISYILFDKNTADNIVSFILPSIKSSIVQQYLSENEFAVGAGSACTTNEGSHTLRSIGFSESISQSLIRLTFDDKIKSEDCDNLIKMIIKCFDCNKHILKNNCKIIQLTPISKIIRPSLRIEPEIDISIESELKDPIIDNVLLTYGELTVKGANKQKFIDKIKRDVRDRLENKIKYELSESKGGLMIALNETYDYTIFDVVYMLKFIPGINKIITANKIGNNKNVYDVCSHVADYYNYIKKKIKINKTEFKVKCKIPNKLLKKSEREWEYYIGKYIKERFEDEVNLSNPILYLNMIQIDNNIYLYEQSDITLGVGGLPTDKDGYILFLITNDNYVRSLYSINIMNKRGAYPILLLNDVNIERTKKISKYMETISNNYIIDVGNFTLSESKAEKVNSFWNKYNYVNHVIYEPDDKKDINFYDKLDKLKNMGKMINKNVFCNTLLEKYDDVLKNILSVDKEYFEDISESSVFSIGLIINSDTKGLVLISGGIDSPVTSSILHENNISHDYVHFMSNYDDEISKTKIIDICKGLNTKSFTIYFVDIGKLQKEIVDRYKEEYRVMLYKIYMVKIACQIADTDKQKFLGMGNSWGQVASQTPKNIYVTDRCSSLPIFCPLIGSNKSEIIELGKKVGTYEKSICNSNDCCVMYIPDKPVLNASEKYIDYVISDIGNVDKFIKICKVLIFE